MKILVVQLARLGDILNSLPAIHSLRKRHPNATIDLMVRASFADAARLSKDLTNIIHLPVDQILEPAFNSHDLNSSLNRLEAWIKNLDQYDRIYNLTFSDASAYLCGLMQAGQKFGPFQSDSKPESYRLIADRWSQYFYAFVQGNSINCIHLVDLFSRIVNEPVQSWPIPVREESTPVTQKTKATRVAIQLKASQLSKCLSIQDWEQIISSLLSVDSQMEFILLGSKQDFDSGEDLVQRVPDANVINLCGSLQFHENWAWLKSADWLLAPDSALVHMASLAEVKVIEIPLGKVRPIETGPYGNGHTILYPVTADGSQLGIQISKVMHNQICDPVVAQAQTTLVQCRDGSVRNDMKPINFTPAETSEFFQRAYYLLAEFRCRGAEEDISIPSIGDPSQPNTIPELVACFDSLMAVRRTAEFGSHYCLEVFHDFENDALKANLIAKLSEVDQLLTQLRTANAWIKPLIDFWQVTKDTSVTNDLLALTEGSYRELAQNVDILLQLLQTAVSAAQKRNTKDNETRPSISEPMEREQ